MGIAIASLILVSTHTGYSQGRFGVRSANPASLNSSSRTRTGKTQADVVLDFAKKMDVLKTKLEEWGTLSFAPLVFSPPSYKDGSTRKAPFKMEEGDVNALKFDALYGDYNDAQGQSLFSKRTQTKTFGAFGESANEVLKETQQTQLDIFRTNTKRAIAADNNKRQLTTTQFAKAQRTASAAEKAAEPAQAKEESAQEAQIEAAQNIVVAEAVLAQTDAEEKAKPKEEQNQARVALARTAVANAKKEQAIADGRLAAAKTANLKAAKALQDANLALTAAESAFNAAQNPPIATPAGAPPSAFTDPLTGLAISESNPFGTAPPSAGAGLATLGDNALPDLVAGVKPENSQGSFSPMARINGAAAALTVKNIHSFLGDPQAALEFKDKRILFGVSSLSVNPGWRTRKDFKAVVTATIKCALVDAHLETIRKVLDCEDYPVWFRKQVAADHPAAASPAHRKFFAQVKGPEKGECARFIKSLPKPQEKPGIVVSAVTPMVDNQNLDLASSIARQDEIALYLAKSMSVAGSSQAAKAFTSWASMRRRDVATRTAVATMNSSTVGGKHVSFEIGTSLKGLDDKDLKGNKAAQTLDRVTFPVLVMLGMSADDARPAFRLSKAGKILVQEPELDVDYSTQWARVENTFWTPFKPVRKMSDSFRELIQLGEEKDVLRAGLEVTRPLCGMAREALTDTKKWMETEYEILNKTLYGTGFHQTLPAMWLMDGGRDAAVLSDSEAQVDATVISFDPATLRFPALNTARTVVIRGKRLNLVDAAKLEVVGAGLRKTATGARLLGPDAISVELEAVGQNSGSVNFLLPHSGAGDSATTAALNYEVKSLEIPTVKPWSATEYKLAGEYRNGLWKGTLELMLEGTNLELLPGVGDLMGVGLDPEDSAVGPVGSKAQVKQASSTAALVTFTITSKAGKGHAFVQFDIPTLEGKTVVSAPFKFTFQNSLPPTVLPWGIDEFLISGTEADAKWTGTFEAVLKGSELTRLGPPTLKGVDGTVEVVSAEPSAVVCRITLNKVAAQKGQGYLEFGIKNAEAGSKVFTEPFKYNIIRRQ